MLKWEEIMDDQKVILQMTSTQVQEDGQQAVMELTTAATLHKTKDAAVLEYEETGDSGLTGQAVIELKGDTVMLSREGEASMRLILKQGCKYVSTYSTPFGRLDMEALFGARVNLQCWVKVKEDWRNRDVLIKNLGFK